MAAGAMVTWLATAGQAKLRCLAGPGRDPMCGRTDMALLQSCCCWHSLRKGSYASALYTMQIPRTNKHFLGAVTG
ncbi:hypothetical protein FOCC_FOCC004272 [Frankliniella occidentalis]|nr:hypothetical protein FOCC_FOCC004272 [Frankliniella occidentalis]